MKKRKGMIAALILTLLLAAMSAGRGDANSKDLMLYLKFDEAARGRTCLYISHRLSSTRFCDRILLMEQGQVMEDGTHEELMARGGRYRELFEMQSRYYREREEQRRRNAFME